MSTSFVLLFMLLTLYHDVQCVHIYMGSCILNRGQWW